MAVYYVRGKAAQAHEILMDYSKCFLKNYPYKTAACAAIASGALLNTSYANSLAVGGWTGCAFYVNEQSYLYKTGIITAIASRALLGASYSCCACLGGIAEGLSYGSLKLYKFLTSKKQAKLQQKESEAKKSFYELHVQRMKAFLRKDKTAIDVLSQRKSGSALTEEQKIFDETCRQLTLDKFAADCVWDNYPGNDAAAYNERLSLLKDLLPPEKRAFFQ